VLPRLSDNETLEKRRDTIEEHVRDYHALLLTYFRFRLETDDPAGTKRRMPKQVVLVLRRYHVNDPKTAPATLWSGPIVYPIARWQTEKAWDAAHSPVEWFNPVTGRFEPTPR
jgi:hypothetical protein